MSGARPPTPHAGKSLSLRHSDAVASTIGQLDAASFTRLKLSEPSSPQLERVDGSRRGTLARALSDLSATACSVVGLGPTYPHPLDQALGRTFMSGDCERRESVRRKNAASASRRSPSSIERCIFAHETVTTSRRQRFYTSSSLEPRMDVRLNACRSGGGIQLHTLPSTPDPPQ